LGKGAVCRLHLDGVAKGVQIVGAGLRLCDR
jgi:hypothetical protein